MAAASLPTPTAHIVSQLSKQTLHFPNVQHMMQHWPKGPNPNIESARLEAEQLLRTAFDDPGKLAKLGKCDFGGLAALCFPTCAPIKLIAATRFLAWIFLWDDEIDMGEGATQTSRDQQRARDYCHDSLRRVRQAMDPGCCTEARVEKDRRGLMSVFDDLSRQLHADMSSDQRARFSREIEEYISETAVEQTNQQQGCVASFEDYMNMRLRTSGIGSGLALCEFTAGVDLPSWAMDSQEMVTMWREITSICMLINDVYSLKKELGHGVIQNAIPILVSSLQEQDLAHAVEILAQKIEHSIALFDETLKTLHCRFSERGERPDDLIQYADACRMIATGLLEWLLTSPRYGMHRYVQPDGSVIVPLGCATDKLEPRGHAETKP
ncbi:isoprenoid synthase domain-containing protein [Durotheca rogersii]|uniref:isoprenoid synthase domain-containing protein n=1 Tax=Durotheca rogersii TaxID=419775 RepID=UPI00221FF202|nr:isoprenoid synthase domain-containing protein [Durotheca rogersii]KAI5863450.1 isoprenoid synthase domain-containing protein [Durotheca rogersii]